jgi:SAM-dependent methyltransferase
MLGSDQPDRNQVCPVCAITDWEIVRQGSDRLQSSPRHTYYLASCKSCGLVSQIPIPSPSDLKIAYASSYDVYRPAWSEAGWPCWKILRQMTTLRRIKRLNQFAKGHRLLEVGCGAGDFLLAARKTGWHVSAIEYNDDLAELLKGKCGLDVRTGQLEPGVWKKSEFDAVVAWNVVEHLPDPFTVLSAIEEYLRPGATFLFSIPTKQAAESGKYFGDQWALLDLPRHIFFLSHSTVAQMCSAAGLNLLSYKTPAMDTLWCYFASAWRTAQSSATGRLAQWVQFVFLSLAISLCSPYLCLLSWLKKGTEAVCVATKGNLKAVSPSRG